VIEVAGVYRRPSQVVADGVQQLLVPDASHGAAVADIAHTVGVAVGLARVGIVRAVVVRIGPAVAVEIVRLAVVADAVSIRVALERVGVDPAVVHAVEDGVGVRIGVVEVEQAVAVAVVVEGRAVPVRVLLAGGNAVVVIVRVEGVDRGVTVRVQR
jgi:hypothetical protein